MGLQAAGLVLFMGVLIGSMSVISRFMLQQFEPMTFTAIRLAIAGSAFFLLYAFGFRGYRWPTDKRLWRDSIFFGVIGDAVQLILFFSTLRYLSAGLTAILWTFFPVMTVVLAHFTIPGERLTIRTGLGVGMGLAGALLIVGLGETGLSVSQGNSIRGYVLLLIAGLISVFFYLYARKFMVQYPTMDTVSIRVISAAVTASVLAFFFEPNGVHQVTGVGIGLILFAAAVFFFGFILTFYILKRFGVTVASMVNYIPPVVASVLGMMFLGERITPGMVAGMLLILAGVGVINFTRQKENLAEEPVSTEQ